MRLFLDASVLLAACASANGASRAIFRHAGAQGWVLVSVPYALHEVRKNLAHFPPAAASEWTRLRPMLLVMKNVLTADRPAAFPASKYRPILFSALAWADMLLALDRADFASLPGGSFCRLRVLKPGHFIREERAAGRLPAVWV
jgi:predicted nucleic acid-binding protein